MSDNPALVFLVFGVPGLLAIGWVIGKWAGHKAAGVAVARWLEETREQRVARWEPVPGTPAGEPGTPLRLVSDYEDAIYEAARHNARAQWTEEDEAEHARIAAELHARVRRLRAEVLARVQGAPSSPADLSVDPLP